MWLSASFPPMLYSWGDNLVYFFKPLIVVYILTVFSLDFLGPYLSFNIMTVSCILHA